MKRRGLLDVLLDPETYVAAVRWYRLVENGADPIEALHGHVCSPDCWHQADRFTPTSTDDD